MRFEGKRGLVLGVANRRSIAWAIAKRLADEGAHLAFTFQGERGFTVGPPPMPTLDFRPPTLSGTPPPTPAAP